MKAFIPSQSDIFIMLNLGSVYTCSSLRDQWARPGDSTVDTIFMYSIIVQYRGIFDHKVKLLNHVYLLYIVNNMKEQPTVLFVIKI